MKMNKIVLASSLSVSLLGASTSVFADKTDSVDTKTSFTVTGGSLKFTPTTTELNFGELSMLDLAQGKHTPHATTDFDATVTDTVGDGNGWKLNATYSGMKGTKTEMELGDKLNINGQTLLAGGSAATVFSASSADVQTAMQKSAGVMNVKAVGGETGSIYLDIPANAAKVDTYTGKITWTASSDTNDAADATTTTGVTVPTATIATTGAAE